MKRTNEGNKKKRNQGFSLVELIVVMAIMGILAVTVAPRFMHYVDKSKRAADQEVVKTIYEAVRYAIVDTDILSEASNATAFGAANGKNIISSYYTADGSGKSFQAVSSVLSGDRLGEEIVTVLGNFKLKANAAKSTSKIMVKVEADGKFHVGISYSGSETKFDYKLSSTDANPTPTPVVTP